MKNKARIDYSTKPYTYYDMDGKIIRENDSIEFYLEENDGTLLKTGRIDRVYLLKDEESLGIDATNPEWIKNGRAYPCEYGCYALNLDDLKHCKVIRENNYIYIKQI